MLSGATTSATVDPIRLIRIPFIADHFSNRTLIGSVLLTVVYKLSVDSGSVKPAHDINPDLVLVDSERRAWQSLDAGRSCPPASSAYAADAKLKGFPELVLKKGFRGESDVTYAAPLTAGQYDLVSLATGRSVSLPEVSLPSATNSAP